MRLVMFYVGCVMAGASWFCLHAAAHLGDATIGLHFLADAMRQTWTCLFIALVLENAFAAIFAYLARADRRQSHLYATVSAMSIYAGCVFAFGMAALNYAYPGYF